MTSRADFHLQRPAERGFGGKTIPASTGNLQVGVVGMNVRFHCEVQGDEVGNDDKKKLRSNQVGDAIKMYANTAAVATTPAVLIGYG